MQVFLCLGSAYIFVTNDSGITWTQKCKIVASDGASSDNFGNSVSINSFTALIGVNFDDDKGSNSGQFSFNKSESYDIKQYLYRLCILFHDQ